MMRAVISYTNGNRTDRQGPASARKTSLWPWRPCCCRSASYRRPRLPDLRPAGRPPWRGAWAPGARPGRPRRRVLVARGAV